MVREEVREHRYQAIPIPPPLGEPVYHRNAPRRVAQSQQTSNSSSSSVSHDDDDNGDWATRCLLPSVVMLPSVVLPRELLDNDSRPGRRKRRLRQYGRKARSCCGRKCVFVFALLALWNLVAEDWWWPLVTWNREEELYPTKILMDFSNVASIHDLSLNSIESLCQVCLPIYDDLQTCAEPYDTYNLCLDICHSVALITV